MVEQFYIDFITIINELQNIDKKIGILICPHYGNEGVVYRSRKEVKYATFRCHYCKRGCNRSAF